MLSAFQGFSKLQKYYAKKSKGTSPYLPCNSIDQNLLFFIFFFAICNGDSS